MEFGTSTVGADLVLTERNHKLVLHTSDGRTPTLLGTFAEAASAWRAIDALDAEEVAAAA